MDVTVLIVDDDASACNLLADRLIREGFKSSTCSSAEEAIRLIEENSFDVIISAMRLPGMSGMDLLEIVHEKHPQSAFLIMTSLDDVRLGLDALERGANESLVKPFQPDSMVGAVGRALIKKSLERDVGNYRQNLHQMGELRTKQLQIAMKRIEKTYDETLEALGAALDLRDTETEGHSRRVSRFSLEMAKAMGCKDEQLKQIARGSYLHDIGKIGIPDAILLKPGRLSEEETAVMQTHARVGYDLVCRIGFLAPAAEIVLTHQERYDGTGYPLGLAGDEIPLGGRIFAVADTLDAMTSDRPYRRALPWSNARTEILREAGRQFDPEVVRIFLSIPDHVWETIRFEIAKGRVYSAALKSTVASSLQALVMPIDKPLARPPFTQKRPD